MGTLAQKYGTLLAILILAAFLRFYHLDTESLWWDEGASLSFAHMEGASQIVEESRTDHNYPTYYLILHYWIALFGDSDFSLRTPSALAGLLAVFAIYKVGCLLFDRGSGLMASLILALSPFHIRFSQEARVYSFMALSALLSFYFFVKVLRERTFASQTGYVLCTCMLVYSHLYGLLVLLAQNIYLATMSLGKAFGSGGTPPLGFVRWLGLQTLVFILYLPGFLLLLGWIRINQERSTHTWIPWPSLRWVYDSVLVGYSGSPPLLVLLLTFSLIATVVLVRSGAAAKLYLLLAWLLIPVALPLAVSGIVKPIFAPKYGIAASLALYLLSAKGVQTYSRYLAEVFPQRMPSALKIKTAGIVLAIGLTVLFSKELWSYYTTVHKTQWREAAGYVDRYAQAKDLVLIEGPTKGPVAAFDHYLKRTDIETESASSSDAAQSKEVHKRIWDVALAPPPRDSPHPQWLDEEYAPIAKKGYYNVALTLYEKKAGVSPAVAQNG